MSLQQQRRGPLGRIIYFNPRRRRRCVSGLQRSSNGNRQLDSISVAVTVHVIVTFSPALIPATGFGAGITRNFPALIHSGED
jgi:hypothetical protein